eukprot:COSAG04_NODE_827_length_10036_cov_6.659455_14_plen_134_part_00
MVLEAAGRRPGCRLWPEKKLAGHDEASAVGPVLQLDPRIYLPRAWKALPVRARRWPSSSPAAGRARGARGQDGEVPRAAGWVAVRAGVDGVEQAQGLALVRVDERATAVHGVPALVEQRHGRAERLAACAAAS